MKVLIQIMYCLVMLSCTKEKYTGSRITAPVPTGPVKTWLALGDSYTIGEGVNPAQRFAAQTANLLKQDSINMNTPEYIATTGWSSYDLAAAIPAAMPVGYDVVSLLIGVNDQYRFHDTAGYRQRFSNLLSRAIQLANGKKDHVFVLSIPDYSVTPFAANYDTAQIRREIDWFNAINKNVTESFNCSYLDITPSTRQAKNDLSLLAADGLHPSALEYRRWADRLRQMAMPVLK